MAGLPSALGISSSLLTPACAGPCGELDWNGSKPGPAVHFETADRQGSAPEGLSRPDLDRGSAVHRHRSRIRAQHPVELPLCHGVRIHVVRHAAGAIPPPAGAIAALLRALPAG